jgi:hypothetical protein
MGLKYINYEVCNPSSEAGLEEVQKTILHSGVENLVGFSQASDRPALSEACLVLGTILDTENKFDSSRGEAMNKYMNYIISE